MADHVFCVSIRVKNKSGRVENLKKQQSGRFNNKLTLEDICNMVISEAEIDANANKALDDQVKVKLSAKESSDTFEIVDYTGQLMTVLDRKKILKFIVFTIQSEAAPSSDLPAASTDTFTFMMAGGQQQRPVV